MSASILEDASSGRPPSSRRVDNESQRVIRIVFDYHPVLSVARVQACIDSVCDSFRSIIEPSYMLPVFQIAWKGSLKPLWLILRNNHYKLMFACHGWNGWEWLH